MKLHTNTTIEEVAGVIGFNATVRLIHWFGGANIYIPNKAHPNHPLAAIIGLIAFNDLCAVYGGQTIWVPVATERADMVHKRFVAKEIIKGRSLYSIAEELGVTLRHVQRLRKELEEAGILAEKLQ